MSARRRLSELLRRISRALRRFANYVDDRDAEQQINDIIRDNFFGDRR